jgi:FkbM family methyltransferase
VLILYRKAGRMRWVKKLAYYGASVLKMLVGFENWPAILPFFLGNRVNRQLRLRLRHPQVVLIVRSAMDIWSVKETFLDQFYTRFGVPVEDDWTVMDIGAGIGDYAIHAAYGKPNVQVYAFEPFPGSFSLLRKNLALNKISHVHAFQQAVWRKTGQLHLDIASGEPLQFSSHNPDSRVENDQGLSVDAVSLDSVLSKLNLSRLDLLKMDCEGAEYEILFNTPSAKFQMIDRIIMEYHDLDGQHSHPVLIDFLERQGYQVTCHENIVHAEIGYLYAERGSMAARL